jgi:hypothetical protein
MKSGILLAKGNLQNYSSNRYQDCIECRVYRVLRLLQII